MPTVLVTGGTGYLGQFLVQDLSKTCKVAFTYNTKNDFLPQAKGYKVNLVTGAGLQGCIEDLPDLDVVVNCAAVSQPGVCEKDPELSRSVNVPSKLVEALKQNAATGRKLPLVIHISTDQVYDGSKAYWGEADATEPVNEYGKSKLEAEEYLQANYPSHVILRSSIIFGPLPPKPVPRALFLQFVDEAFSKPEPTTFFDDEFRCPIYVNDIVGIVRKLIETPSEQLPHRVFNMGGPERLSRVDMAEKVADCRGHDKSKIKAVPSKSVARGVVSPPDISMDVQRLRNLGVTLTPFSEAIAEIFQQ